MAYSTQEIQAAYHEEMRAKKLIALQRHVKTTPRNPLWCPRGQQRVGTHELSNRDMLSLHELWRDI